MIYFESMVSTKLIKSALNYYNLKKFKMLDVPMVVPNFIVSQTCPDLAKLDYHSNNLVYTGSAEQSFLHLIYEQAIICGKYYAITPCLRDEILDTSHYRVFLKIELINIPKDQSELCLKYKLHKMINHCFNFFKQHRSVTDSLEIKQVGSDQFDIYLNNIEIGSYGIRQAIIKNKNSIFYIYGTGLAEPRFSFTLNQLKK